MSETARHPAAAHSFAPSGDDDRRIAKIAFVVVSFLFIGFLQVGFPRGERVELPLLAPPEPGLEHVKWEPEPPPPPELEPEPTELPKVFLPSPERRDPAPVDEPMPEPRLDWRTQPDVRVPRGPARAPPSRRSGRVRVDHAGLVPPELLERVMPEYPRSARRHGLEGWVVVEAVIDRSGTPAGLQVRESSHRIFEERALDAVRKWRFTPGALEGRPVEVILEVRVDFTLD